MAPWHYWLFLGVAFFGIVFILRYFYLGRSFSLLARVNDPAMLPVYQAVEVFVIRIGGLDPKEQFEEISRLYHSKNEQDIADKVYIMLFLSLLSEAAMGYRDGSLHPKVEAFFDVLIPKYYPKLEPFIRVAQEDAAHDGLGVYTVLDEIYESHFHAAQ